MIHTAIPITSIFITLMPNTLHLYTLYLPSCSSLSSSLGSLIVVLLGVVDWYPFPVLVPRPRPRRVGIKTSHKQPHQLPQHYQAIILLGTTRYQSSASLLKHCSLLGYWKQWKVLLLCTVVPHSYSPLVPGPGGFIEMILMRSAHPSS